MRRGSLLPDRVLEAVGAARFGLRRAVDLDELRRHWSRLAEVDPLWAVYVAPGKRGGRWRLDAFLTTGRAEVERTFAELARRGLLPARRELALDFGCGVGRLSGPLAEHFTEVVGVDISAPMLAHARRLDRSRGSIRWVLNDRPDLGFQPDGSVDLVYSSLVLQHLPRHLATGYLREFLRVLRPGGTAVVQVTTAPRRSLKGWAFRWLPNPVLALAQRVLLRYPAPMRMTALPPPVVAHVVAEAGGVIQAAIDDDTYGGHWTYTRYVIGRAEETRADDGSPSAG